MIHEVSMGKWREELKEFWYQRAGTSGIINSSAPYDQVPYSILVSMTKTALAHSEISGSLHSIKSWYDEDPSRVNILSDEFSYPHKDEKNFGDFVHWFLWKHDLECGVIRTLRCQSFIMAAFYGLIEIKRDTSVYKYLKESKFFTDVKF